MCTSSCSAQLGFLVSFSLLQILTPFCYLWLFPRDAEGVLTAVHQQCVCTLKLQLGTWRVWNFLVIEQLLLAEVGSSIAHPSATGTRTCGRSNVCIRIIGWLRLKGILKIIHFHFPALCWRGNHRRRSYKNRNVQRRSS